jgi:hypothetical protein
MASVMVAEISMRRLSLSQLIWRQKASKTWCFSCLGAFWRAAPSLGSRADRAGHSG